MIFDTPKEQKQSDSKNDDPLADILDQFDEDDTNYFIAVIFLSTNKQHKRPCKLLKFK